MMIRRLAEVVSLLGAFSVPCIGCGGSIDAGEAGAGGANAQSGSAQAAGKGGKASDSGGGGKVEPGGGADAGGAVGIGGKPSEVNACDRTRDAAPGVAIYSESATGKGQCSGLTLGDVIEQIRELRPDLDDVALLYAPDPEVGGDGSFVYAFQRSDGGFALVFKRGAGDCPAGCTINDYWYFETGAECSVEEVGHTHRDFETCVPPDALPRWGIPPAAQPETICGADLSPEDLSGDYALVSCGTFLACTLPGDKGSQVPLPASVGLTIAQDANDLASGTVTLEGTGEPLIDGQPFPAAFERRKLKVAQEYSNLPATCLEQWSLTFDYDFEGLGPSRLTFEQAATPDCESAPGDYCKGSLYSEFGEATQAP